MDKETAIQGLPRESINDAYYEDREHDAGGVDMKRIEKVYR